VPPRRHTITRSQVALLGLALFAVRSTVAQVEASRAPKSPAAALAWSLAGTTAPTAIGVVLVLASGGDGSPAQAGGGLIFAGGLVGPSLGHFYAGRSGRGAATIGLRILLVTGTAAALTKACIYCYPSTRHSEAAALLGLAGLGLTAASVIYDVATAPGSARRYNERRASFSIAPHRFAGHLGVVTMLTVHL